MHTKALLATLLLSTIVVATPVPDQNVPITDAEWAALEANGLSQRDVGLQVRNKAMNCGKDITGDISIGGHNCVGALGSVQHFYAGICYSYTGSDITKGHQTPDTYPVTLTNQRDPTIPGAAGNVVFAIYNTGRDHTYLVNKDTCTMAMEAPVLAYPKGHKNGKGDQCYGSNSNEYEGGYYLVDGIGAFGSKVP